MADFIKIADRCYEGASTDTKPTGCPNGSLAKETDTLMTYITYDFGVTWLLTNNELYNISALEHYNHSRSRVYPQDVEATATLIAAAEADKFGDWAEIIPIDTVDFGYEVTGVVIEAANAATTYFVQLGFSLIAGTEPTTAQICGERRTLLPTPVTKATELLEIKSQNIPANAKLWGRVKSASGDADQLGVSVEVLRHIEITNPVTKLVTWPWST